jgi:hypothetical protein
MKNFYFVFFFFAIYLTSFISVTGQKLSDRELQSILTKAAEKTSEYSQVFKNLTVEETKTFETFDENGSLKSQKKIISDLIIYEPENNKDNFGEFRNIREVDGQKIKDSDKRTVRLFAELANTKSFQEELKKLNKESSRYDKDLRFYGITSSQAFPLLPKLISSFKFDDIGRENIEGNASIVVRFQQIAANPNININIDTPDFLGVSNIFYRGIIWLDLKNYRILRFKSELLLDSEKFIEPFVFIQQEYFYQPGKFEIYLPQKIISENFNPQLDKQTKLLLKTGKAKINSRPQTRLLMEYKNFSIFDVKVKSN